MRKAAQALLAHWLAHSCDSKPEAMLQLLDVQNHTGMSIGRLGWTLGRMMLLHATWCTLSATLSSEPCAAPYIYLLDLLTSHALPTALGLLLMHRGGRACA